MLRRVLVCFDSSFDASLYLHFVTLFHPKLAALAIVPILGPLQFLLQGSSLLWEWGPGLWNQMIMSH